MRQGVYITRITGSIIITNNAKIFHINKEMKLGVNWQSEVVTDESSYGYVTDHPHPESKRSGFFAILFPKTKVIVYTGRGFIKKLEIIKGLVFTQTSKVVTPSVEFKGEEYGGCWIEVDDKGQTIVANTRDTIYNRKTRKTVSLNLNQQVLITENDINEPEPMEQKFFQAKNTLDNLYAFGGAEMYQQVAEKSDALLDAYLVAMKSMAERTGQDFEKIKEEAINQHRKYKQWAQTQSEELYKAQEKVTRHRLDDTASVILINQTVKYQDVEFKIVSVKREASSDELDLLSINVEAKNESPKQIFIFWNEEFRLINKEGKIFSTDDYNLETSYIPKSQTKGYLFVAVNKNDEKFKLQFGKKSLPKIELELDLSKIKGGD